MSIKLNEINNTYAVSVARRDPITKKPYSLRRVGIKTKIEAKRVEHDLINIVLSKLREVRVPCWENVVFEYVTSAKDGSLSESTKYSHDKNLRKHTFEYWGLKPVDQIATHDIFELLKRMQGYSEAHKKYVLKCIRGVFTYALNHGYISVNPTPTIKFKIGDKIQAVLTEAQIITLLKKAQEHNWPWYFHYAFALYTGMRNGELYALSWDQVDIENRRILVNRSWNSKNGFKSTKSGDDRIVSIPKPLIPTLQELKLKADGRQFVLPRLAKWDKGEQARELRIFLELIGLPSVRFHDLRASWATLLLSRGAPATKVMVMGGWKNLKTMMIYLRKAGVDLTDATQCIDHLDTHGVELAEVYDIRGK